MRSSRQFQPGVVVPLEARINLSAVAHHGMAAHVIVAKTTPSTSILSYFPEEAPALAAGHAVYEQRTTSYYDGLTQTDDETFVFSNQTITVTENITLPGQAGTETAVDHYTATSSGVLFQNSVIEPNGQTETESRTDSFTIPHKVFHNGSIQRPDGVTISFTGKTLEQGQRNIINNTFEESNGISYKTHEVDINRGQGLVSVTVTTNWNDGSLQVDKDSVSTILLPSPPI